MSRPSSTLLVLNGGSSSLKFAVFDAGQGLERRLHGQIEPIGGQARLVVSGPHAKALTQGVSAPDHAAAIGSLLTWFETAQDKRVSADGWIAVGHRVVHGGPDYFKPTRLDQRTIAALAALSAFDPDHMPGELAVVQALSRRFPALPQIACFDTAFHHDLPTMARQLAIPRRYQDKGVRRYGFHGLSYAFAMSELARLKDPSGTDGRVILAHLGAGASLAAVRLGRSIDTTMGFTPASGVPMATRSGDIDPGLGPYLAGSEGMSAEAFGQMINFESGLLGLSETSGDMRVLLDSAAADVRAREAVDMFCYQVKKTIGAYAAALEGLDTLVFTGGIGENSPRVRTQVCEGLGFLGIAIDGAANARDAPTISMPGSGVTVRVIKADEERMIARSVATAMGLSSDSQV